MNKPIDLVTLRMFFESTLDASKKALAALKAEGYSDEGPTCWPLLCVIDAAEAWLKHPTMEVRT